MQTQETVQRRRQNLKDLEIELDELEVHWHAEHTSLLLHA